MMRSTMALLVALSLVLAGCTKSNPDEKPVYFVPPTADVA